MDKVTVITNLRIESLAGTINFDGNQAKLSDAAVALLDRIGRIIRQNPTLRVEISVGKDENENDAIISEELNQSPTIWR
ncbi:hypothetical protein BH20ACI1_BH20ACI1_24390 [soil metagenome]